MSVSDKDLLEEAIERVVEQFKGKEKFEALVTALTDQATAVQTALLGILNDTNIATVTGDQLDGLGAIVGEERFGRDDDAYRLAIRARIILNFSRGTADDIINLIRALIGNYTVKIREYFPASFIAEVIEEVDTAELTPATLATVGALIDEARGAAIGSDVLFHVETPFRYDSGPGYDLGEYADVF